ncbi:MAG: type III-A CRISPR-associated protein Csm2 [Bacteroidetes bacterium]|nr:type III-A CRISPR-associated protein Csm2 [Bacteroidota bacterium]MBU2584309.1 type III-A CRISPR-associated protein Csm2 [Bacteroidota bacterium]
MDLLRIDSFYDSGGNLVPQLITNHGTGNVVDVINHIQEQISDRNNQNKKLNINQLRKFYDTFLKIYNNKSDEKEKKIQLLMLKANAEYSAKRLHTNRFKEFLANKIDLVISKNDTDFIKNLKALKLHLEALVAYYPKN